MISLPADPRDREERLERVRRYLAALGLVNFRAIVSGSVGRGDFAAESDTDLPIVSDELPADLSAQRNLLFSVHEIALEGEPIGLREEEWRWDERQGNSFVSVLRCSGIDFAA